jgi:predicted chitinase
MSRTAEFVDYIPELPSVLPDEGIRRYAQNEVAKLVEGNAAISPAPRFRSLRELGLKTDTLANILLQESASADLFAHLPKQPGAEIIPTTHELQTWFSMPSVRPNAGPYDQDEDRSDKTDRLPIVIEDDPNRPDNAFYIAQSITDLPPRWKTIVEEVAAEAAVSDERRPLRERLKSTYSSVVSRIDEKLQPTLLPGEDAQAILDDPEPLNEEQMKLLLLDPNKKFVSLFLTLCLTMQNPEAPILQPVDKIRPIHPPSGPMIDGFNAQPSINLSDLAAKAQAANVISDTVAEIKAESEKKGTEALKEPQSEKEEMQQLIAKELKKAEILTPEVLAYTWATVQHETASSWRAVREGYWLDEKRGLPEGTTGRREARVRGYGGGEDYYGRGLIQVTHDTGYRWVGEMIGMDLVNNPDKLLNKHVSVAALTAWVKYREDGWGYTMVDYINDGDFIGARSPVNGTDKAVVIAAIAKNYLDEAREMCAALG